MKIAPSNTPSPLMALQQTLNAQFQAKLSQRDQTQVKVAPLTSAPPTATAHKVDVKA